MTRTRLPFAAIAALLAAGCLAPGVELAPLADDFAFFEIQLQG